MYLRRFLAAGTFLIMNDSYSKNSFTLIFSIILVLVSVLVVYLVFSYKPELYPSDSADAIVVGKEAVDFKKLTPDEKKVIVDELLKPVPIE